MMRGAIGLSTAALVLALASTADARDAAAAVKVESAWALRAPMLGGSGNGAVYGTLVNPGSEADALVSAASDVAGAVELHESYLEAGLMKMREVAAIDVAAGRKLEMKPGGYHVMLLGLRRDLKPGESISVTLRFRKAGAVVVAAAIR